MSQPTSPHPVPRIEYVETARRRVAGPTPGSDYVLEPMPQPWHVRYIGANGECLTTSEQLGERESCDVNALAMARLFGVVEPLVARQGNESAWAVTGYVDGAVTIVPVVLVRRDVAGDDS